MFRCPYCRRDLPDYFVPSGHQRVPVICFECHWERQDVRKYVKRRHVPPPDPPPGLTPRQYEAWRLTAVRGLSHQDAGTAMGISHQAVSRLLGRIG